MPACCLHSKPTLLARDIAVTAAHCINPQTSLEDPKLVVIFGTSFTSPDREIRPVTTVNVNAKSHENAGKGMGRGDIAEEGRAGRPKKG